MPPPHKIRRESHSVLTLNFLKKSDFTMIKRTLEICGEIEKMVFQQSVHVESIVLLSKLKSNKLKHINVELEMDELDLMAAESKATYEEVKDYVSKAKRIES